MAGFFSAQTSIATGPMAAMALLWAGVVIGVSGLATPVKFTAPALSRPAALDVGRVTFRLLNRVEWIFALILIATGLATGASWLRLALIALVIAILGIQAALLLPALNSRAAAIIRGEAPSAGGSSHLWYVVCEGIKLGALIAVDILA